MTERRRYLVPDAFVQREADQDLIHPGQGYQGEEASSVLPGVTPWVRLIHPTQPDTSALVVKHLVVELLPEDQNARS